MWFFLSLIAIAFWGGGDLFSKIGSAPEDRYSHWKITAAVGLVMGVHATATLLSGAEFHPMDFIRYLPASALYIASMILGYAGLRYLMLSVCSPICNSSGAVAGLLCLIFLRQMPDLLSWFGIILISVGVIGLSWLEQKQDAETKALAQQTENRRYVRGFTAILFPLLYCVLDGLGTFADAVLLDTGVVEEESANIAYEYTFLAVGLAALVYVVGVKRQRIVLKNEWAKLGSGVCETAGQMAYIYAIGEKPVAVAPMVSAYCVFSVVLSRVFLKEKLSKKHGFVILLVLSGIVLLGISEGLSSA